jgi:hypothetical protein
MKPEACRVWRLERFFDRCLSGSPLLRDADVFRLGEKAQRFFAAAVLVHAADAVRMSFRSEAFTFRDVGKTFATSGSKMTTFVPWE